MAVLNGHAAFASVLFERFLSGDCIRGFVSGFAQSEIGVAGIRMICCGNLWIPSWTMCSWHGQSVGLPSSNIRCKETDLAWPGSNIGLFWTSVLCFGNQHHTTNPWCWHLNAERDKLSLCFLDSFQSRIIRHLLDGAVRISLSSTWAYACTVMRPESAEQVRVSSRQRSASLTRRAKKRN